MQKRWIFCQECQAYDQILGLGEVSVDEALRAELDLWASRVTPEPLMPSRNPTKPPPGERRRALNSGPRPKASRKYLRASCFPARPRQTGTFGPKFTRSRRNPCPWRGALESAAPILRALLGTAFGLRSPGSNKQVLHEAIRQVAGLEAGGIRRLESDEGDKQPVAYSASFQTWWPCCMAL